MQPVEKVLMIRILILTDLSIITERMQNSADSGG